MGLADLTAESVRSAMEEFDMLGREEALARYGFGKAKEYFVIGDNGHYYDSKALAGIAHKYLSKKSKPLRFYDFGGGEDTVRRTLRELGFNCTGPDTKPFVGAAPGDVMSNAEFSRRFRVGNMGGMRRNARAHHLCLISDPSKGLYEDRWEGDVLHYTGEGKVGPQKLNKQNRTLYESAGTDEVLHFFEVYEPAKYTYLGEVELAGTPYQEQQPDTKGNMRSVWMFPIRLKPGGVRAEPTQVQVTKIAAAREKIVSKLSTAELRKRANQQKNRKPPKRTVSSEQYARDPVVVELVKRLADGVCDLCGGEAPFLNKKKQPYLECHHIVHLAKGGPDTISNAVALCPNCHRRMHILDQTADRKKLRKRAALRDI